MRVVLNQSHGEHASTEAHGLGRKEPPKKRCFGPPDHWEASMGCPGEMDDEHHRHSVQPEATDRTVTPMTADSNIGIARRDTR